MANTNYKKYNTKAPAQNKEIQKIIVETNYKRFGTKSPIENENIKQKIFNANEKKYGYKCVFANNDIKELIIKRNMEKYGYKYALYSNDTKNKIRKSKRRGYWYIYRAKLKSKKINPLFDIEHYVNGEDFKFQCFRHDCNKIFQSKETEAYNINCGCLKTKSKYEDEIIEELIKNGINKDNIKRNKWYYLDKKRLELDIYLPEYSIGIEYYGLFWHSELYKNNEYHQYKKLFFDKLGIQVIQIFENEWINKNNIVKSIIKSKLNKSERIYGRKCVIKNVDAKEYNLFITENHLQGSLPTPIKLGLYYNDELVCVMGLGKSRYTKKYEYEILRFCIKNGLNITGGFSKLLKYFETKYNPKSIISYVDCRYFNGNSYEKSNFSFLNLNTPSYYYYYKNNECALHSRIKFQKHKLKSILPVYDYNKSEHQNMIDNKYYRVYDAGNLVYIKDLNQS